MAVDRARSGRARERSLGTAPSNRTTGSASMELVTPELDEVARSRTEPAAVA